MIDEEFEHQLRTAFASRLEQVSPDREARLRAFVYHPRPHRFRRRSALTTAAMTAVAALVAAVLVLLGSGTQTAFAGWTKVPVAPTAQSLVVARAACGSVPASGVLAADSRGPYTAIVYMHQGKPWQCVAKGRNALLHAGTPYRPSVLAKPDAGKVTLPLVNRQAVGAAVTRLKRLDAEELRAGRVSQYDQSAGIKRSRQLQEQVFALLTGPDSLTSMSGVVGRGVTGITFVLRDGRRVQATVRDGWYLAWWPGSSKTGGSDPTAILVRTAAGLHEEPYSAAFLNLYYHPCLVNERCVGPARVKVVRSVAPALTQHFALFRDTQPIPSREMEKIEQQVPGIFAGGLIRMQRISLGLDISDAREVSFGARGTVLVTPGTEGICLNVIYHEPAGHPVGGDGQGGCDSLKHDLTHGTFITSTGVRVSTKPTVTRRFVGIVPDGNRTVTAHFEGGQTRTVPVRHNVVLAQFSSVPSSITYKDAKGKPAHWPS